MGLQLNSGRYTDRTCCRIYHESAQRRGSCVTRRVLAVLGAYLAVSILQFVGVVYVYRPFAGAEPAGEPLVPRALGFALSMALLVLFHDWVTVRVRSPLTAALIIAVSQVLLVDIDYVLSGERSVAAGAASAVVLLASWGVAGFVYGRILPPPRA